MASATLIYHDKSSLPDGSVVEMTIWRLPEANDERPHGIKYSLYFGKDGERIVGYDNERGKGDHRHIRGSEVPYAFAGVEQLMADFLADVEKERML
jgi:Family of unknown function (DUF6516)